MVSRPYDKFNQLIADAELSVVILANNELTDFELVGLAPGERPTDIRETIATRGLSFIGTAGLVNGAPRTALAEPLDNSAIAILSEAYIRHVETKLNAMLERASLTRMFSLPDYRA